MSRPSSEAAIGLFRERFLNRTDFVGVVTPYGRPRPVEGNGALEELLASHVLGADAPAARARYVNRRGGTGAILGPFRVGSYCPAPDGTTRWLCLDFDGKGHANALADPLVAARQAREAFTGAGLPVYLERSGGGRGWHLWCFFDPPISAAKASTIAST